ncbi:hypothetical protein MC885_001074 [Smutsia gigantea]|nr:hypothetical protein MC885_001074 [Smutsia gigantea]
MRSGGVALDTCLAKAQGGVAQLSQRLKRTREASPCPVEVPSWVHKPAGDANRNSQSKELSLEMKNDLNEANLVLHNGEKMSPYLKESLRRNSASLAAQSKTVDLFFAPAEEHFAGVSRGVGKAPVRDWLGGGPRAADSHREQYHKGEPRGSGLLRWQKPQKWGFLRSRHQGPTASQRPSPAGPLGTNRPEVWGAVLVQLGPPGLILSPFHMCAPWPVISAEENEPRLSTLQRKYMLRSKA